MYFNSCNLLIDICSMDKSFKYNSGYFLEVIINKSSQGFKLRIGFSWSYLNIRITNSLCISFFEITFVIGGSKK